MRIVAQLDEYYHAHIFGYFACDQFRHPKPIHLLVDTGCTITTLLSDDVTRLGINCTGLNQAPPTSTANGLVVPFILPNANFILEVQNGWFNRNNVFSTAHLNEIHCSQPTHPQHMTPQRIVRACSILGMDFLRYFPKWQFKANKLYLDTS